MCVCNNINNMYKIIHVVSIFSWLKSEMKSKGPNWWFISRLIQAIFALVTPYLSFNQLPYWPQLASVQLHPFHLGIPFDTESVWKRIELAFSPSGSGAGSSPSGPLFISSWSKKKSEIQFNFLHSLFAHWVHQRIEGILPGSSSAPIGIIFKFHASIMWMEWFNFISINIINNYTLTN